MLQNLLASLVVVISTAALCQNCPEGTVRVPTSFGSYCGQTPTGSTVATSPWEAEIRCASPVTEVVLHASPAATLPVVDLLQCGERVTVLEERADWFRVHTRTAEEGYVQATFVSQFASTPTSTGSGKKEGYLDCIFSDWHYIAVFESAGGGNVIAKPKCGEKVSILESDAPWYKVRTGDGSIGYVRQDFVSDVPKYPKALATNSGAVSSSVQSANTQGRIRIQVVTSESAQRDLTYADPGSPERSTTHCNSDSSASAIGLGGVATAQESGTTNCTTITRPATPPSTVVIGSLRQAHVHAIMPDGTHVTLWCEKGFRDCRTLSAGFYFAEVKGNTVWMHGADLSGKEHRIKYRLAGSW